MDATSYAHLSMVFREFIEEAVIEEVAARFRPFDDLKEVRLGALPGFSRDSPASVEYFDHPSDNS